MKNLFFILFVLFSGMIMAQGTSLVKTPYTRTQSDQRFAPISGSGSYWSKTDTSAYKGLAAYYWAVQQLATKAAKSDTSSNGKMAAYYWSNVQLATKVAKTDTFSSGSMIGKILTPYKASALFAPIGGGGGLKDSTWIAYTNLQIPPSNGYTITGGISIPSATDIDFASAGSAWTLEIVLTGTGSSMMAAEYYIDKGG